MNQETWEALKKATIDAVNNDAKKASDLLKEKRKEIYEALNKETSKFQIKDSGKRVEFSSGMVRDIADDKIDYELVFNGPMLKRWAQHLTTGNKKYPDPEPGKANWMRAAGVEEAVRFRKSAVRHFAQWLMGATDEDHASAVLFNINGYEHVKEKMLCQAPTNPPHE